MEEIQVQDLTAGSYFGEIALIKEAARSATIKAMEHCVVLEFTKEAFDSCFKHAPGVKIDFKIKLAEYHCSLEDFLEHKIGQEFFHKFLASEFSTENLEFWIALETYKDKLDKNSKARKGFESEEDVYKFAESIVKMFILNDATKMLNISSENKRRVLKDYEEHNLSVDSFKRAIKEIKKVMEQDSFRRFKKSAFFRDFLYQSNSYVNLDEIKGRGPSG